MATKTTPDGFLWLIVDTDTAKAIFKDGKKELFALYDDDSEGTITKIEDIDLMENIGIPVGLEVGFIYEMMPACPKCGEILIPYRKDDYDWECQECNKKFTESQVNSVIC